jgi:organic radical activating enzyme
MNEPLNCVNTHNKVNVVNNIGFVTPCCDHIPPQVQAIKLTDIQSFNEVLTHPTSVKLRDDLNAGEKIKNCSACWNLETAGLKSRRMFANEDQQYKSTVLEELEIALDFTCNMMCRICGPYHSSKWSGAPSVLDQLHQLDIQSKDRSIKFNVSSSDYQTNFYKVLNNSDFTNLKTINIVGGEPFYSKNFEPLIDKLSSEVDLENLDFTISTNASIFPSDKIIEKLSKMKKLNIRMSIDAIGDLASVIRYGVDWKVVEQNVIKWRDLRNSNRSKVDLKIHCTLSLLNINALQELTNFCDLHDIHFSCVALKFPEHLSIYQLPLDVRQKWNVIDVGPSKQKYTFLKKILEADMSEKNRLSKFLSTCSILDNYQGNSFKDVNPEIYQLAEELKL